MLVFAVRSVATSANNLSRARCSHSTSLVAVAAAKESARRSSAAALAAASRDDSSCAAHDSACAARSSAAGSSFSAFETRVGGWCGLWSFFTERSPDTSTSECPTPRVASPSESCVSSAALALAASASAAVCSLATRIAVSSRSMRSLTSRSCPSCATRLVSLLSCNANSAFVISPETLAAPATDVRAALAELMVSAIDMTSARAEKSASFSSRALVTRFASRVRETRNRSAVT
mmetsp:Transcript_1958/g.7533  ORF Transcript_1958/g.7533 Transcript_1958/m.7533 type:complete len:234 (-) Transcript_1958:370-1071(-)